MKVDQLIFDVLRMLALPNTEKLRLLGAKEDGLVFMFPDASLENGLEHPIECFTLLAAKTLHEAFRLFLCDQPIDLNRPDLASESLQNVSCVLDMTLDISRSVIDYFWIVHPEKSVTGPYDRVWPLLQFLSKTALIENGQVITAPQSSFEDMLRFWSVVRVRQPQDGSS